MRIDMRLRSVASLLALLVVLTCCDKGTPTPQAAANETALARPQATGITQGLTKRADVPLYNIERIGELTAPLSVTDVRIPGSGDMVVMGWAVDPINKDAGSGVDVVIDNVPYLATSAIERRDVSTQFAIPGYRFSGYSFLIPASALGKGTHHVSIRVVSRDGKSYIESPAMKFTLL
jgi:hypothetical protein